MDISTYLTQVMQAISKYGFAIQAVQGGTEPSFCYTIGLEYQFSHPELIVTGLPPEIASHYIHKIVEGIEEAGQYFKGGTIIKNLLDNYEVAVIENSSGAFNSHLIQAQNFYTEVGWRFPLKSLQVIFPDKQRNYPWQKEYRHQQFPQPLLEETIPVLTMSVDMDDIAKKRKDIAEKKLKTYRDLISEIRLNQILDRSQFEELKSNLNPELLSNLATEISANSNYQHLSAESLRRAIVVALQLFSHFSISELMPLRT